MIKRFKSVNIHIHNIKKTGRTSCVQRTRTSNVGLAFALILLEPFLRIYIILEYMGFEVIDLSFF